MIALKTKASNITIDFLLTQYEKKLTFLESEIEIQVVYSFSPIISRMINKREFTIEQVIGKGGFSTVYLGNII